MCVRSWLHSNEKGSTLLKRVVAAVVVTYAALVVVQYRMDSQDTIPLLRAQRQVAAIFRDVIARNESLPVPVREKATAAQVVFHAGGSELNEYVTLGDGWQEVHPAGNVSLKLPTGVAVSAWTFPINAFRAVKRWHNGHGTTAIPSGSIRLTKGHRANVDVHVDDDGRVWY